MTNDKLLIYRILDANLNRAREGLRVVEEICRFVLEDKKLTLAVKEMRGKLSKIIRLSDYQNDLPAGRQGKTEIRISENLIKARKAAEDVGRKLYTKSEARRDSLKDIFEFNLKRSEEAVRCLEEFSKLINPKWGREFKQIRFKIYELEKKAQKAVKKLGGFLKR